MQRRIRPVSKMSKARRREGQQREIHQTQAIQGVISEILQNKYRKKPFDFQQVPEILCNLNLK